ncbi:MAG TPA: pilus assembly protein TadG-related protein [Symbiobacteriaceae bacterium]|nr:pilus assembly protein TadG-related protein [Symbiobacteriaceae bacterium]
MRRVRSFLSRLRRDTRGAVMVMAAASFTALLLFAGLALDFGRAHLLRAQLQTAVDAASLAGALQVVPMVQLRIDRWEWIHSICRDPVSGRQYDCSTWETTSPAIVEGPHWDLVYLGGWRNYTGGQCNWPYQCGTPHIAREWAVLPESTAPVARNTFAQNASWPTGSLGPQVLDLTVTIDRSKPVPEVTATATMSMPTTFLKLAGIEQLQFTRSGTAAPVKR